METITYKNTKFNVWDVGGQDKIQPLWRHYFSGTQGLVFVVDSADKDRMEDARKALSVIIQNDEMKDALLLVFANKQDMKGGESSAPCSHDSLDLSHADQLKALPAKEVCNRLQLDTVAKNHIWKVEPSCATSGEGIFEGLAWLSSNVKLPAR